MSRIRADTSLSKARLALAVVAFALLLSCNALLPNHEATLRGTYYVTHAVITGSRVIDRYVPSRWAGDMIVGDYWQQFYDTDLTGPALDAYVRAHLANGYRIFSAEGVLIDICSDESVVVTIWNTPSAPDREAGASPPGIRRIEVEISPSDPDFCQRATGSA